MSNNTFLKSLACGIPEKLPSIKERDESIPHAPFRNSKLTLEQKKVGSQSRFNLFKKNIDGCKHINGGFEPV